VAPSVRFNVRAMLDARAFFLAADFNVRTSAAVQARRFNFLAMWNLQVEKKALLADLDWEENKKIEDSVRCVVFFCGREIASNPNE